MPQFDLASFSSQLFWLGVVFSFLYFLVNKFIVPKAESILTNRNNCLEENIRYAEEYNTKIKSINTVKSERIEEVNSMVEDMQKQAIKMLEEHFCDQQKELESVLAKKRKHAIDEIDSYANKFHANEPDACINLASFIIKKITNKSADLKLLKKIHGETK